MNILDNLKLDALDSIGLDISDLAKVGKLLGRKEAQEEQEDKCVNIWAIVLIIIGIVAIGVVIGFVLYNHFKPDYLEDFEDEFEDDFDAEDEDFFVDEE